MCSVVAPEVGDFVGWVVGSPGHDVDYAICIERNGDNALLRSQAWQIDGCWNERWVPVVSESQRYGCWKTARMDQVKEGLRKERARLFPNLEGIN